MKAKGYRKTSIRDDINETAKYSVKPSDYLTGNLQNDLEVVKDLV
ncbi:MULTISPECIES: protein rep [Sporosarcina]|nr:protein rep [Sporosarcina psychrophila]